jgi:cell division protein FtsB
MSEPSAPPPPGPSPKPTVPLRRGRFTRYLLGFIAVILLADAIVGEKGLLSLIKARRDFQLVEQALQQSRLHNAELREQARRLREDSRAVEEVARRELGLIKPGEKLFIVREPQKK